MSIGAGADESSNHTQSTAYLVGETAAEKIIAEYALHQQKGVNGNAGHGHH
jgi:hypothetical protein